MNHYPVPVAVSEFIPRQTADAWRGVPKLLCSHVNIPMEAFYPLATDGELVVIRHAYSGVYNTIKLSNVQWPKTSFDIFGYLRTVSAKAEAILAEPKKKGRTSSAEKLLARLASL